MKHEDADIKTLSTCLDCLIGFICPKCVFLCNFFSQLIKISSIYILVVQSANQHCHDIISSQIMIPMAFTAYLIKNFHVFN